MTITRGVPIDLADIAPGMWITRHGWRLAYNVHAVEGETILFENGPKGIPQRFSAPDGWHHLQYAGPVYVADDPDAGA